MIHIAKRTLFSVVGIIALLFNAGSPAYSKVIGDTIIFGAAVSESGKYSTAGKHTRNGYNLAVKRINGMGGVRVGGKYYKIKIKYYDDESTPARGAQLAERLINQDGTKFMLGPYSSGLTKAIAPVTEKYKVPMVEGNGAHPGLFLIKATSMFLPCCPPPITTCGRPSIWPPMWPRRKAKVPKA